MASIDWNVIKLGDITQLFLNRFPFAIANWKTKHINVQCGPVHTKTVHPRWRWRWSLPAALCPLNSPNIYNFSVVLAKILEENVFSCVLCILAYRPCPIRLAVSINIICWYGLIIANKLFYYYSFQTNHSVLMAARPFSHESGCCDCSSATLW